MRKTERETGIENWGMATVKQQLGMVPPHQTMVLKPCMAFVCCMAGLYIYILYVCVCVCERLCVISDFEVHMHLLIYARV